MTEPLTIDIAGFYAELERQLFTLGRSGQGYDAYGKHRARDCHYAARIMGFEVIPVGNKSSSIASGASVSFTHIYNRPWAKPDLQYLIAPDARVPNYTSSLGDALELALRIGMKQLTIPSALGNAGLDEMTNQILAACDHCLAMNHDIQNAHSSPAKEQDE